MSVPLDQQFLFFPGSRDPQSSGVNTGISLSSPVTKSDSSLQSVAQPLTRFLPRLAHPSSPPIPVGAQAPASSPLAKPVASKLVSLTPVFLRSHTGVIFLRIKPDPVPPHLNTTVLSVSLPSPSVARECGRGPAACNSTARPGGPEAESTLHRLRSKDALDPAPPTQSHDKLLGQVSTRRTIFWESLCVCPRTDLLILQKQGSGPGTGTSVVCGHICECAWEPRGHSMRSLKKGSRAGDKRRSEGTSGPLGSLGKHPSPSPPALLNRSL